MKKKHIFYVANIRFPSERAHSIQIVKMCNAFSEIGCKVTLCVSNRKTHIIEPAEDFYGEKFNFDIKKISVFDTIKFITKIPKIFHSFSFLIQRLSYILNLGSLQEADIIYSRDPAILFLLGIRIGFEKLVYESHEAHYNWFVRFLVGKGVKIVVISEGIRDFYLDQSVTREKLLVAHDGIDDSFFASHISTSEARTRLNLSQEGKVAMYIGGFDKWKGVDTFFEASKLVQDVTFVAIGGSDQHVGELQKLYPKITFLGYQPYRDLFYNQQAADVLVIPNTAKNKLSSEYTSPLKLFAHMTAKKPLLVSEIPSLKTVLGQDAAFYFEPDNPESLAINLEKIVQNLAISNKKANKAFEMSKQYSWNNRARAISSFINL